MRRALLIVLTALLVQSAQAQPAPPWWKTAVCPMAGPFNATSGPKGKTPEQILSDFRPEVAEWSCLPALETAMETNPLVPRAVRGGLEYQEYPQARDYELKLWRDKFGFAFTPTEDNGVDVPSSGQAADFKYGSENAHSLNFMCHNAPRWHDFHRDSILRAAKDPACSLVRQDNICIPPGILYDNGGWCKWCLAGFRARLQGLSAERLAALGIADATAFEPRAYLQGALRKSPEERLEDPIVREYTRFMHRSNLDLWKDEVAASHAARSDVPICGNQGDIGIRAYAHVILSDASDLIFLENLNRDFAANPNGLWYALCLAGGRHSRPAWIWDFSYPQFMEQVAGSQLFLAECYANGVTPYYEMDNVVWNAQKGFYRVPLGEKAYPALASYAQFAHDHNDLLIGNYAADTPVALLYSLPSFLPRYLGAMKLGDEVPSTRAARDHFVGWGRALEAAHVPYNVEVLGDQELWPDQNLDDRLARYSLLVCPDLEAVSDGQLESLRQFQVNGGRLLISGSFANRDETFARRLRPGAPDLERSPASLRLGDEPVRTTIVASAKEVRGASQVVEVNQAEAKTLVVRGWSKAEGVSGPDDHHYSLWVDVMYNDGTALWEQVAPFRTGTHDWQMSELAIQPAKPIKSVTLLPLLRNHAGKAWFDDLFLGEQGSDVNLVQDPGFEAAGDQRLPAWEPFVGAQSNVVAYAPDRTVAHSGRGSIACGVAGAPDATQARLALSQALEQSLAQMPHLQTNAPTTVQLRPYSHGRRMIVHLLNLNIDAARDEVTPAGPFMVTIPLPPGTQQLDGEVMLVPADGDQTGIKLPVAVRDGSVEIRVPGLRIWSIVTFEGD